MSAASKSAMKPFALAIHIHFNQERHLHSGENFKLNCTVAFDAWRQLGVV